MLGHPLVPVEIFGKEKVVGLSVSQSPHEFRVRSILILTTQQLFAHLSPLQYKDADPFSTLRYNNNNQSPYSNTNNQQILHKRHEEYHRHENTKT